MDSKRFYITTAIDYANGDPHIGHAYEKILADVMVRARRLMGKETYFLTGLDEHGQKVQRNAESQGREPQDVCDEIAEKFRGMCDRFEISYDDYIRTTEPRHKEIVQQVLQDLYDRGEIYKAEYQGYYSVKEEQFLQEKDRVDGEWPSQYGEVVEVTEVNYFFKLSKYQGWLKEHYEQNPEFVYPESRGRQVTEFLKEDLNDLCISRPKDRLHWGIELPFDQDYVTYVWFDALLNYLSAIGYGTDEFEKSWPVDYHVIGKDILVPAHGIYWPVMLKAMGLPLPRCLFVHGWWRSDGEKMSKSLGNVVDPLALADEFGEDAFRYFVMREMAPGADSEFREALFLARYNVLANDLGNLVSRLLNMGHRYTEGKVPEALINEAPEEELLKAWEGLKKWGIRLYESNQIHSALTSAFEFIREINKYAETRAPWKLAKSEDPEDRKKLETSLAYMAEGLRLSVEIALPVMPGKMAQILELLGAEVTTAWGDSWDWDWRTQGNSLGEKTILFPKRQEKVNA